MCNAAMATQARQPPLPPTGLDLSVRRWGVEDPLFFLVHGFGDGAYVWNHLAPSLLSYGSAVAVDLRGHGDSPRDPTAAYSADGHVADVSMALDTLCRRPVILVGHSLGAEVAIRVAAQEASKVRAVVLVDGGPQLEREAVAYMREQFALQSWWHATVADYTRELQERLPLSPPALLGSVALDALTKDPRGGYRLKCDESLKGLEPRSDDVSLWSSFRSISCPILAMRGAGSAVLTRSIALRMTRENARCSLLSVVGAGHAVMLDNAEGFMSALRGFMSTLHDSTRGGI